MVFLIFGLIFLLRYFLGKVIFMFLMFWLIFEVKLVMWIGVEVEFLVFLFVIVLSKKVFFLIVGVKGLIWFNELLKVMRLKCEIVL